MFIKTHDLQDSTKRMPDDILHSETLEAAKREKKATYELLEFLFEVDRRRLYLIRGYSSLFVYVRDYLGYGDRQAFERVAAMRLVFKIDEVRIALQEGKLNLTTTAQFAVHVRKKQLTTAQTLELLSQIEDRPKREIEKILEPGKLKTITVEIDDECEALLERFKELEGNPGLSIADCLKISLRRSIVIKERKNTVLRTRSSAGADDRVVTAGRDADNDACALVPEQATAQHTPRSAQPTQQGSDTVLPASQSAPSKSGFGPVSRYISKFVREMVAARAQNQCEYVDLKTGKRCDGKHGLQFDHITPFAVGGETVETNLQLLCPAHNRLRAIQTYGEKFMGQWIE